MGQLQLVHVIQKLHRVHIPQEQIRQHQIHAVRMLAQAPQKGSAVHRRADLFKLRAKHRHCLPQNLKLLPIWHRHKGANRSHHPVFSSFHCRRGTLRGSTGAMRSRLSSSSATSSQFSAGTVFS